MQQAVTLQDFQEWERSAVTKAFKKALNNSRERLKELVITGAYDPQQETEVKGICKSVSNILDLTYEELMEGLTDAKH
jgi:pyrroline-5-carboxylate reductase